MTATPNWCIHGVSRRQAMDSSLLCMAANTGMKILEFHHLIWDFFCFIKLRTEKKEEGWCLTFTRVSRLFCVFFCVCFLFFVCVGFFLITLLYPTLKLKYFLLKKNVTRYWLITQNTVNICYLGSITVLFEVYEEIWFLSSWKAHSFYILNDHVPKNCQEKIIQFWKNVYYFS